MAFEKHEKKINQINKKIKQGRLSQEIADEMNISIKTVEAHITAALKSIRKKLGEKYYYLFWTRLTASKTYISGN